MSILQTIDPAKLKLDNTDLKRFIDTFILLYPNFLINLAYYYFEPSERKIVMLAANKKYIKKLDDFSGELSTSDRKEKFENVTLYLAPVDDVDSSQIGMVGMIVAGEDEKVKRILSVIKDAFVLFHRSTGFSALQEINALIVGEVEKDLLLQKIVNLVTKIGQYKVGFITLVENGKIAAKTISQEITTVNIALKLLGDKFSNFNSEFATTNTLTSKAIKENKIVIGDRFEEFVSPPAPVIPTRIGAKIVGVNRFIAVPINEGGITIGSLNIATNKDFSINEIVQLKNYADQIGITILNSKLFTSRKEKITDLEDKNKDLTSLFSLSSQVSKSLDPDKVAQIAVDSLPQDDTMVGAIITEYKRKDQTIRVKVVTHNKISSAAERILGGFEREEFFLHVESDEDKNNPAVLAVKQHKPIFVNDLEELLHPPIPKKLIKPLEKILGVKSAAVYPLMSRGVPIGTVAYLIKDKTAEELEENQKQLYQTFTSQIAIALENARLFKTSEEIQKNLANALSELKEIRRREQDMIDIMGHELRTPMSVVRNTLSAMELVLKTRGAIPQDKQRKYVDIALESARREANLIETLLSATKADSKGFELTFEKISLSDAVKDAIIGQESTAKRKDLALVFEKTEEDVEVYCDRTRIQEIVDNFTSNAVKYTEKGSVTLSISKDKEFGYVQIKDTGVGITPEDISNLGKKFYRAKQYGNKDISDGSVIRPGGTGLGLYVSFALTKLMDGGYKVESEVGKGSTFTFWLPLYKGQEVKQLQRKLDDYSDINKK